MTEFYSKAIILAQFYQFFKEDEDWEYFIKDNLTGIELASSMNRGLCMVSESGMRFVSNAFQALLNTLGTVDTGIDDMFDLFNSTEFGFQALQLNHQIRLAKIQEMSGEIND